MEAALSCSPGPLVLLLVCSARAQEPPGHPAGGREIQGETQQAFDASKLDSRRWSIPAGVAKRMAACVALGKEFFGALGRRAFLKALRGSEAGGRIEIAWVVPAEGRYLGCLLSRTRAEIERMSDEDFVQWRGSWSVQKELAWRRFHPLPGEIRGYGDAKTRARVLETTRLLIGAESKNDFLAKVAGRIRNGYLSILFVPRGGQGPTWYGFPAGQVEALSEPEFQKWRERFLRWIEIHTPGQSRVTEFATASDEDFEKEYLESKRRHGSHDIGRALRKLEKRLGIRLEYPRYGTTATAAVIAGLAGSSVASEEGLRAGDRVLRVEGLAVPEWNDFIYQLGAHGPGSTLKLGVRRGGEEKTAYFTLPVPER